ncbi:unnamed protein product [Adineta steineri]|uniref:Uncharacterized protein n=1 Tax=Adineta steineri TaxID=433720 RepID=A0A820B7Y2_9BILA|nr:unnamed protein product [Adineta steineri]CAF4196854.1 unnamed protein product [Adineta steineri]
MERTNHIEPLNIDANQLSYAAMIISTQMEIIRRVEVMPTVDKSLKIFRLHPNLCQSRTTSWSIGCLFLTTGILALSITIIGLIITFETRTNGIERYDLGDLHYGINNMNQANFSSNTYLSNLNKIFIEKYLSNQLVNESGFRNLVIDRVFVRNQFNTHTCETIFIIENIQVYFDECFVCKQERNLVLYHSFFNITSFQQPLHLILNNFNILAHICSTPNSSHSSKNNTNSKSMSTYLETSTQISRTKFTSTNTILSTNPFERIIDSISTNNHPVETTEESLSFTTDHVPTTSKHLETTTQFLTSLKLTSNRRSSTTTNTNLFQKPPASIFQFLPFRPSTTNFHRQKTLFKRSK